VFAVAMSACIIAQLPRGAHYCIRHGSAFPERLQRHEHCMTSSAELPKSDGYGGISRVAARAGRFPGNGAAGNCAIFWLGTLQDMTLDFMPLVAGCRGAVEEGIFFPRWTEWANHGFGEPRFIFYPPLSWMLGAALGFAVSVECGAGSFIVIAQTMAGICAFALARRFLRGTRRFLERVLCGESVCAADRLHAQRFCGAMACALMPLVLLTALELCGLVENRHGSLSRAMALFAVAFAAVWLSNAPAECWRVTAWRLFSRGLCLLKILAPLWRGAGGLALGFGLASFYLLPAAYEQRWVNITQALSSACIFRQFSLHDGQRSGT